jgi:hypothetical protein
VQPPGVVPLHDEDGALRLAALAAERLWSFLPLSLALVLRELLDHAVFLLPRARCVHSTEFENSRSGGLFTVFKLYVCRLHNEHMAGISLWTVWTVSGSATE